MLDKISIRLQSIIRAIKNSKSIFYYSFFVLLITATSFFFFSKDILKDDTPILNTKLGQEVFLGESSKLILKKWEYNQIKNFMEIEIKVEDFAALLGKKIDIKAISRVNPRQKIPVDIKVKTNELYVVRIKNIPEKYHTMALKFTVDDEDLTRNKEATMYADNRKIVLNNELKDKKQDEYIKDFLKNEIKDIDVKIEKLKKEHKENEGKVVFINENVAVLNDEMKYQTNSEKEKTLSIIKNFKSEEETIIRKNLEIVETIEEFYIKQDVIKEKISNI